MTRYVGIDPSLTGTAVAIIDTEENVAITRRFASTGKATDCLPERLKRLWEIEVEVEDFLATGAGRVPSIAIEGPSFGQHQQRGEHQRAGLWWGVANRALNFSEDVFEVPPSTLKKYATGRGNASKDEVISSVIRHWWATYTGTTNDEADAFVLACIAAELDGQPFGPILPAANRAALDKLKEK